MTRDGSPPSSWYDPPEPRHSDRTIIPDECNCSECHDWHISEGMVEDNADNTDYQCCVDQMDTWIEDKQRCEKHPKAYVEPPTKTDAEIIRELKKRIEWLETQLADARNEIRRLKNGELF